MARKEVKKSKKEKVKENNTTLEKEENITTISEDEQDFDIEQLEKVAQGKVVKRKKDKKKKQKKQASVPVPMTHVHESAGQNRALVYLRTWANDRASWKFEKCRQIWLLQNIYEDKVNDADFQLLASYTCSIQGHMRENALGKNFIIFTLVCMVCQRCFSSLSFCESYLRSGGALEVTARRGTGRCRCYSSAEVTETQRKESNPGNGNCSLA
jgi:hypothetical protein